MNMIKFINPLTGEMRLINISFNKALFFYTPIMLYKRKLNQILLLYKVFSIVPVFGFVLAIVSEIEKLALVSLLFFILFLLCSSTLFFIFGNIITIKIYIREGFRIVAENEFLVQHLKLIYKLPDEAFIKLDTQLDI